MLNHVISVNRYEQSDPIRSGPVRSRFCRRRIVRTRKLILGYLRSFKNSLKVILGHFRSFQKSLEVILDHFRSFQVILGHVLGHFSSFLVLVTTQRSIHCSTNSSMNKGVFLICRSGLFLAQIHPSKVEKGISLNMEEKCRIMSVGNTRERTIMTHRIL